MTTTTSNTMIRIATANDVPEIRKVIRSSIEGIASKDYPQEVINNWGLDTAGAQAKQSQAISSGKELTWVAVKNKIIVGFCALAAESQEVRAVYIAAAVARQGVGSELLTCLENEARKLNFTKLSLNSSITAVPFYTRHGYIQVEEIVHTLFTGVKMRAVRMNKNLN